MASGARSAYQAGAAASSGGPIRSAGAGLANVAKTGASAVGQRVASGAKAVRDKVANFVAEAAAAPSGKTASAGESASANAPAAAPAWAQRLQRNQRLAHGASTAAHALRSGDHGGGGTGPSLRDDSNA